MLNGLAVGPRRGPRVSGAHPGGTRVAAGSRAATYAREGTAPRGNQARRRGEGREGNAGRPSVPAFTGMIVGNDKIEYTYLC